MAAALAASMAMAHVQDINPGDVLLDSRPASLHKPLRETPAFAPRNPSPASQLSLIPDSRAAVDSASATTPTCDTRLGQLIAKRCAAIRTELAPLGMSKLKQRATAEGLSTKQVAQTLQATHSFGDSGIDISGAVAQQALRERLIMHIAYRPAEMRGKFSKQGSGDGIWNSTGRCHRRLFVLDADTLCYYENNKKGPPKYRPKQTIALDDIVMVAEAPDRAEAHGRQHCFSITTASRVFCMLTTPCCVCHPSGWQNKPSLFRTNRSCVYACVSLLVQICCRRHLERLGVRSMCSGWTLLRSTCGSDRETERRWTVVSLARDNTMRALNRKCASRLQWKLARPVCQYCD